MASLELVGPCGWWAEPARTARWLSGDQAVRDVVVWLGPELDRPAHARARDRAAPWLSLRLPGLLPLLDVLPVQGRTAWVYEARVALSLGAVIAGSPEGLPLRPATELVARVAGLLEALGPAGGSHPGPDLDHLLLEADGSVWIAGFAGPSPRSPSRREPHGRDDPEAVVWRLGVLYAELVTGQPTPPCTDRAAHDTALRRLVIRAMSRPGPAFPDRVRDRLLALLAWEPAERPPLSRVASGLRDLAASLPDDDLAAWCARTVPAVRARTAGLQSLRPPEAPLDSGAVALPEPAADRTEERVLQATASLGDRDEITVVSVDTTPTPQDRSPSEQGAIPVLVGPPVEVARRAPKVPRQIFDPSGRIELPVSERPTRAPPRAFDPQVGWTLVLLTGALVVLVLMLLAWRLLVAG